MTPFPGAAVLVNVDAAHNGGNPVAPGLVTALNFDGTVNVRVLYDTPPGFRRHRREWLDGITLYDTCDVAEANRHGLYGAFWPPSQYATIIENQEKIMTALQDLQNADAALKAEVTTFLSDVAAALSNAGAANDPAIEQVVSDINAEVAALQAGDPANAASSSSASSGAAASGDASSATPATGAPEAGTAGSAQGATSVSAGDAGAAS